MARLCRRAVARKREEVMDDATKIEIEALKSDKERAIAYLDGLLDLPPELLAACLKETDE
jgi:hypothetical protein